MGTSPAPRAPGRHAEGRISATGSAERASCAPTATDARDACSGHSNALMTRTASGPDETGRGNGKKEEMKEEMKEEEEMFANKFYANFVDTKRRYIPYII